MKKLIKRTLKILPGGKSFIAHYKQLMKDNADLKTRCESAEKKNDLTSKDYQVFFIKNNS